MIGSNQQQDCTELEARITISDLHTPTTTHKQRDWLEGIRVLWSPLLAERGSVATSGTVQRRQKKSQFSDKILIPALAAATPRPHCKDMAAPQHLREDRS